MLTLIILCSIGIGNAWGADEVVYTLAPATGSNNSYASNCDVKINGIKWNVTGNSTVTPWRLGGKSLTKTDRTVYSKNAISSAITKVELTVGGATSITVNSLKLIVASDVSFNNTIDEVSISFKANSTLTFTPTSPKTEWETNAYYKFVFNVTVSGDKNKYVEFTNAKFYAEPAASCDNKVTISKGSETNGTFTLNKTGEQNACDALSVTVTPSPAEHFHVASVSATNPETTGTAGTAVNNGDGTWTITYSENAKGASTINVAFAEDSKASITLSEAGAITTDVSTYYVGDSYTLPSSTEAVCGTKVLVGWSTVTVSETDTKPASNFYEKGETVTLKASQTFYAVFANASGGGGGEPTAYTAGDEGTYVLAVYVNEKWYALPANPTVNSGKISGVEITVSNTGGVDYVTSVNASGFEWTIANATNGQTISDGSKYIYHSNGGSSGTNLAYGDGTTYTWTIASEQNGLTFKGTNSTTVESRGLLASGTTFGGYALSNEDKNGYYRIHVLPIGGGTTYSAYSTECGACGGNPTIGVASLSGAFSLSSVGVTVTGCAVGTNCSWTDYGFVWGTSANPTVSNNKVQVGNSGTATTWDGTLTGSFTTGMTYHYRAYGKNGYASGTYQYSSDQTFTPQSVTFNLNGHGSSTPSTQYVNNGSKATDPSYSESVTGWRFDGWYANSSCTGSAWDFSTNTVSGDNVTLYAKWTQVYTVTYNYNGGTSSCADANKYAAGTSVTVCSTPPEKAGSTFQGWLGDNNIGTKDAGSTFTMPAANVTLTAQWTDTEYTLSYIGSNYTKTENKTQIKSSDTPLDMHYTCTGTYGFPSTISLSGGGQSWTAGTNYTWTVDESKQSATLHINELAISADVTIGITMKTRYTVTYDYPQGVIGSTPTTSVHYFVNGEAQTLKTVTSVSCGDYDTFEGWTTSANKITVEATSATGILTGSYTATGDITLYAMYSHADGGATGYEKITEGVTAGTYLIATAAGSNDIAYAGQSGGNSYAAIVDVTVTAGVIGSKPNGAKEISVVLGTGNNAGTFSMHDGTAYLKNGGCSSNAMGWQAGETFEWDLDANGKIHNTTCDGANDRNLEYANGDRIACYKKTQISTYLYRKGGKKYISTPSCATPTQVTVTYDANGGGVGSITCSGETLDYGTYPALDEDYTICNTFNRTGYTLYKWHTRAGGTGGTDYDPGEVVGPTHAHTGFGGETVTLYAQWRKKVSFNIGNATGSVADVVDTDNDGNITLPDATGITAIACGAAPNSYTLIGWSETPVDDTHDAPTSGFYAIGATYPCTRSTLYAVYRGDRDESTDPNLFTLSYTTGGGDTWYLSSPVKDPTAYSTQFNGSKTPSDALAIGIENVAGQTYKAMYYMDGSEKIYFWYANSSAYISGKTEDDWNTEVGRSGVDKLKCWNISDGVSYSTFQWTNNTQRYLHCSITSSTECVFRVGTTSNSIGSTINLVKGAASSVRYTYSSNPSCSNVVTISFNLHGGSFTGIKDADDYVDIEKNSTVQLPNAEWTRDNEWTFVGWTTVSVSLTEDASSITPLYEAGDNFTAINTTLHAVYKYTPTPPTFDGTVSGTWKIYGIVDGTYHYAKTLDAEYSSTSYCLEATDFEFTNISTNKYYIKDLSTNKYLQGRASDKNDILHTTTPVEWTVVSNGDGTWKVSDDRYSDRYLACGKTSPWVIQNGASSQFGNNGNLVYVRFGGCSNTEYASEPTLSPSITLGSTGSLNVTSTNGKTVYAANKLTIEATRYGEQTKLYLFSDNPNIGFRKGDGTALSTDGVGPYIQTDASGELATTNITITYTPNVSTDGIETATITVRDNTSPSVQASATRVIKARHLPTDFVIAAKWGDNWYALPANCTESTSSTAGVLIEVDNTNDPTCATGAPENTKYGLLPVRPGRVGNYGSRLVFTEHLSTATTDNQKTLYNGAATSIQVYATYANYAKENPEKYEWIPTTSDLKDYTLTSATVLDGDASERTVS